MNNIAVFTSITGGYESLKEDQNWEGADWYAFLGDPVEPSHWQVLPSKDVFKNQRRNARWHKLNSHILFPNYEYTIWIDGSITLKEKPQYFIDNFLKRADIASFRHPDRDCIYEEAEKCKELLLDDLKTIDNQMKIYQDEGYGKHQGLSETKMVIRKNNERVKQFNTLWLAEVVNFSFRDQLSFNYCLWKTKINFNYIELLDRSLGLNRYPGCYYHTHKRC
jgi:hypothetical protein